MTKVLLINPSYDASYGGAKGGIVNPIFPTLGLATIAATTLQRGHEVEILDLSWRAYDYEMIRDKIRSMRPDVVGVTATTPLMNQLRDISVLTKDISEDILCVAGGAHPSALPYETLRESKCDIVFTGEADYSFPDICDGMNPADVAGLWYRDGNGEIHSTGPRSPIDNLDELPLPAWELYNIDDYRKMPHLLAKAAPITMAEFSRGCVFTCDFCASKITLHKGYRKKSPERCAEEVKKMASLGYAEFMLADDIFTSDQDWAIRVCEAISATGVKMHWSCTNGIRVESANEDVFNALAKAGCYRVSFGFESGNNEILKLFGKGGRATIEQGRTAVNLARKAGIDTGGYFVLGLSPDTEETMKETIEFARKLPVDLPRFSVAIAFPGTKMFNDYVKEGLVKSYNWDDYFVYTDEELFAHRHLTFKQIQKHMTLAYLRAVLLNPSFIFRRIKRGIRTGELFLDLYYGIKFFIMPSTTSNSDSVSGFRYYAPDRWPRYDLGSIPPRPAHYQVVHKPLRVAGINA